MSDDESHVDQAPSTDTPYPVMTLLVFVACVVVFLGVQDADPQSWDDLRRWGYRPATDIWQGRIDSLVTSVFVHLELWHVLFNLYWLWRLGQVLERILGSVRWLAFFVLSAFVSSGLQLAESDDTGIGASGVVYAIFGFLWRVRNQFPHVAAEVTTPIVRLFLGWAFVCVGLTFLEILPVGNTAHFAGLIFGVLTAHAFYTPRYKRVSRIGLAGMLLATATFLIWCPWSTTWLWIHAYQATIEEDHEQALESYTRILRIDPEDADALYNRSLANLGLGNNKSAQSDYEQAVQLNPDLAEEFFP